SVADTYFKMAGNVVNFLVSFGNGDGTVRKVEAAVKEMSSEIIRELKETKSVCLEAQFDEISTKTGTLLESLNDAIIALSGRNNNVGWQNVVKKFLLRCQKAQPEELLLDVKNLPRDRNPIHSRMLADDLKQNRTLEKARQRIAEVVSTLIFKTEIAVIIEKAHELMNTTDEDISFYVNGDHFKDRMPKVVEYAFVIAMHNS
ncbi:hypothetical protein PMAYCL1PPCAC_12911, partial [Pristionchus mayeri]